MGIVVRLYSNNANEINKFLKKFYGNNNFNGKDLMWECCYSNPIESADIIGVFTDNKEDFNINMWVSLDEGFFLNVTSYNSDKIIRYLFERYPY